MANKAHFSSSHLTLVTVVATSLVFLVMSPDPAQGQGSRFDYRKMDQLVNRLQQCSKYQGLSVAVVGPDGVLYERGTENTRYQRVDLPHGMDGGDDAGADDDGDGDGDGGDDDVEVPRKPVGKDSIFCLGGGTQAFTSVLLSILLEKNDSHTMDTPLHEITGLYYHLPGKFRTQRVTLKDVLAMRTGLSNMDIVALAKGMDRHRLMRNLRFAPEVSAFRDTSVYSEVLYSVAEDAARALGEETWYKLMRQHIFEPLDMKGASFAHMDAQEKEDIARPYLIMGNKHYQIPWEAYRGQEVVAAATSVCASASDMTKWMYFIASGGKNLDNRRVVNERTIRSTFQGVQYRREGDNPRMSGFRPPTVDSYYLRESNALGWIRGSYQGHEFVSQDGSLPGYESLTTILTSGQGGVFTALTGEGGSNAFAVKTIVNMFALDLLLHGQSDMQVCSEMRKMARETKDADTKATAYLPRPSYAKNEDEPARPVEEYVGRYRSYAFGDVLVRHNASEDEGRLKLELQYGEYGLYDLHQSGEDNIFIMQAKGPLKYSTDMDDYRLQGPYLAIFSTHDSGVTDPERPIETVTIPHFDRLKDPEFSKNPRPPRPDYDSSGQCPCNGARPTSVVTATSTTSVGVGVLVVMVWCSFLRRSSLW